MRAVYAVSRDVLERKKINNGNFSTRHWKNNNKTTRNRFSIKHFLLDSLPFQKSDEGR